MWSVCWKQRQLGRMASGGESGGALRVIFAAVAAAANIYREQQQLLVQLRRLVCLLGRPQPSTTKLLLDLLRV